MLQKGSSTGFTLVEVCVATAMLVLFAALLSPSLARTRSSNKSTECLNQKRGLMAAWEQYAQDNNGRLLTCQDGITIQGTLRENWMEGVLDFNSANASNWDPSKDLARSPLWTYVQGRASFFRCPADPATVEVSGIPQPRVRSISLSQAFSRGEWLDRTYNASQQIWRTYAQRQNIVAPAKTFVFIDEHPDSINDGAFADACTGNQPTDAPASSAIIDMPANFHEGGCGISFADGHAEIHRWKGAKIGQAAISLNGFIPLNIPSGDSWVDMHWLAANTTVRN